MVSQDRAGEVERYQHAETDCAELESPGLGTAYYLARREDDAAMVERGQRFRCVSSVRRVSGVLTILTLLTLIYI